MDLVSIHNTRNGITPSSFSVPAAAIRVGPIAAMWIDAVRFNMAGTTPLVPVRVDMNMDILLTGGVVVG